MYNSPMILAAKPHLCNDGTKETCNHCDGECLQGVCMDCGHDNGKDN